MLLLADLGLVIIGKQTSFVNVDSPLAESGGQVGVDCPEFADDVLGLVSRGEPLVGEGIVVAGIRVVEMGCVGVWLNENKVTWSL